MGPAAFIVKICGGAPVVAAWLNLSESRVYRWSYPKDRGGSDGYIPATYHDPILLRARAERKPLRPEHFFPRAFPRFAGVSDTRRRRKAGA